MSTISFPAASAVRALLVDEVQSYSNYKDLRMVVGCVAPSGDGSPYASVVYPIDLSVEDGDSSSSIHTDTPFLLGSTSKTFTAVAYTLLCADMIGFGPDNDGNEGNIDLTNTDLTSIFTSFSSSLQGRTFGDVVTYTAQLKKYNTQATQLPKTGSYPLPNFKEDMVKSTAQDVIDEKVQVGQYQYSNLGFALLGLLADPAFGVLNPVIGSSLATVMQSTLFGPLGLKHTGFFPPGFDHGGVPKGYTLKGARFDPIRVGNSAFPAYDTGGGIMIGGNDLALWLAFNMGLVTGRSTSWDPSAMDLSNCLSSVYKPVLSAPTEKGGSSYPCSGWFVTLNDGAPEFFFKDGSLDGTSSFLLFDPGPNFAPGGPDGTPAQAGVFVMLNCSTFQTKSGRSLPAYIAYKVLDLMENPSSAESPS